LSARHIAAAYNRIAPRWNDWTSRVRPPLREQWVRKIDTFVAPHERVVELGCGTGTPVGANLAARYAYVGVDVSPEMLARARATVPDAVFVRADMARLAFAPASLGAAVAFFSLIHVPRVAHAAVIREIANWLRPGGAFVATLTSRDLPAGTDDDWLGGGPMFWSGFAAPRNERMLRDAGFEIVESAVLEQVEPEDQPVQFHWVLARRRERA
jgi:SAM-dependent methyltransferase